METKILKPKEMKCERNKCEGENVMNLAIESVHIEILFIRLYTLNFKA